MYMCVLIIICCIQRQPFEDVIIVLPDSKHSSVPLYLTTKMLMSTPLVLFLTTHIDPSYAVLTITQ